MEPGCPRYTERSRCAVHERARERGRGTRTQRGYDAKHFRRREEAFAEQGEYCHNPTCPYPDAGSAANPITAQHVVRIADGGIDGPMEPWCKRCNSSVSRTGKGA